MQAITACVPPLHFEGSAGLALHNVGSATAAREHLSAVTPVALKFFSYLDTAIADPNLNREVVTLCAMRIAQLLDHPELAASIRGLIPVPYMDAAVAQWWDDARFNERDRAGLMLTEQFFIDPQGLTDDEVEPVRSLWGDSGLVAFVLALGLIEQYFRLLIALHVWEI